jgi:LysM repeat protein
MNGFIHPTGEERDHKATVHHGFFSRRQLLMLGAALAVSGCVPRRSGASAGTAYQAPPPTTASTKAPRGIWYRVEAGDTLSSISRRSKASLKTITQANNLHSSTIKPGQRLFIPGVSRMGADPLAGILEKRNAVNESLPAAPSGGYVIVRRREWTKAKIGRNHRKMRGIKRITIHHTGEYAGTARLSDREILRRIDRYHREGRKWAAIGYHYLIAPDGRIYEGRPESIQGAHTANNNSHNLGISMMGDFHRSPPNARHLAVLEKFLNDTHRRLRVSKKKIYGHRDLSPSICPGDALYAWLKKYRKA